MVVSYSRNDGRTGGIFRVTVDTGNTDDTPSITECHGDSKHCQLNMLDKYTTYLITAQICPGGSNPHCSLASKEIRDRTIFGGKLSIDLIHILRQNKITVKIEKCHYALLYFTYLLV